MNVRSGSKTDLPPLDRDVRFAALNGLKSDITPRPKSATTGLMHRSIQRKQISLAF
jgi:hypothetical protein